MAAAPRLLASSLPLSPRCRINRSVAEVRNFVEWPLKIGGFRLRRTCTLTYLQGWTASSDHINVCRLLIVDNS